MRHSGINNSSPGLLARLMGLEEGAAVWGPEDFAAVWRHLMAARLGDELSGGAGGERTFGEVLWAQRPALELLTLIKDYAKGKRADVASGVPGEVASVLYYASIVAARVRGGTSLTTLDEQTLADGVNWALAQIWVDQHTRELFQQFNESAP
jgi:hypothetical protein